MAYPHLFSPIRIGPVEVANRVAVSAHHNNFDINGLWSERTIKYLQARAAGGAGLIIAGAIRVHPRNPESICWPRSDWAFAPGQPDMFRAGTAAVKAHGTAIFAQLAHGGRQYWDSSEDMEPLLAPSAIACPAIAETPKEMEAEDLAEVAESFAEAAAICAQAGFDGIEVHAAYGYLLSSFITPTTNRRDDRYGGDLTARMRYPLEVVARVREEIGPDLALGVRMIADERVEGGLSAADAPQVAAAFEASGHIDYLNVVSGTYASEGVLDPTLYVAPGCDVHLAESVKGAVQVPVLVAGRIKDPAMAESIVAEGRADLVAMTRATICDPDMPRKARANRIDEIRWCIGCNQRCIGNLEHHLPISCIQNPVSGREFDPFWARLQPVPVPKAVMVIGAGPAGCEAARVLAERGHRVTLLDRAEVIGGQIRIIERGSGRGEWRDVHRYYSNRLDALGVDLRLGTAVSAADVQAQRPDAVVVATGSVARTLPFEHLPVLEGVDAAVDVRSVLNSEVELGHRVVVYAGDNYMQGLTAADTLLDRGHRVDLVVPAASPGAKAEAQTVQTVVSRIVAKGVASMRAMSALTGFSQGRVDGVDMICGTSFTLECDTLVSCFGGVADDSLYRSLKGSVAELHRIGDCVAPRTTDAAVFEGGRIGRLI